MQRFNSFNMIHKALRAMLYDTALCLQQIYFADIEEADDALNKVETVIAQFDQHALHEDTYVLPAIRILDPNLVAVFEGEHEEDHALGEKLKHIINMFRATSGAEERIACGSALIHAFREFMIFNLEHMAKEEVDINKVLWENYTDAQLMEINARIVASIPAEEKIISSKWMMRGVNKMEAIAWLKGVKKTAPSFVFESLLEMTEAELPRKIRNEVRESVMDMETIF
jgi:hypothetical protein